MAEPKAKETKNVLPATPEKKPTTIQVVINYELETNRVGLSTTATSKYIAIGVLREAILVLEKNNLQQNPPKQPQKPTKKEEKAN